jgi:RND family efflux transporter MFP subunit
MYNYARITAPFDGVITNRYADTGAMIQAGTSSQTQAMPVVQLSQNDLLRLDIPVPESVVAQVHLGEPVQVRVPSLGRTIDGKVTRFADKVDMDTRTMLAEIDVPNPKLQLVPGMYAEATTVLEKKTGVLSVPVQAIDRHANGASVLVATPQGVLEQRDVQLGLETPNAVEITSGIKNGEMVVVSSRGLLRPGEKVKVKRVELSSQAGES